VKHALLLLALLLASDCPAGGRTNAAIGGERRFSLPGRRTEIILGKQSCSVRSMGDPIRADHPPQNFRIELTCAGITQPLWDIRHPFPGDPEFDSPKFKLLWAGDQDGDGRIDLEMELSPNFKCSRKVLFLSSRARPGSIVGIDGKAEIHCKK
jgi:hypothetical protein